MIVRKFLPKPAQLHQHLPQAQQGGKGALLQQRKVHCNWTLVHPGGGSTSCHEIPARPGAPGSPPEIQAGGITGGGDNGHGVVFIRDSPNDENQQLCWQRSKGVCSKGLEAIEAETS